jgi:hypothetical protein
MCDDSAKVVFFFHHFLARENGFTSLFDVLSTYPILLLVVVVDGERTRKKERAAIFNIVKIIISYYDCYFNWEI